ASHFAPDHLDAALAAYRSQFRPSAYLDKPHVMAAMTVIAADTDEEAELLASRQDQPFVRLRSGDPGRLPQPTPGYRRPSPATATVSPKTRGPCSSTSGRPGRLARRKRWQPGSRALSRGPRPTN